MRDYVRQLQRFNVGEDCPVFDGLFEFCQIYTSGSIGAYCWGHNKTAVPGVFLKHIWGIQSDTYSSQRRSLTTEFRCSYLAAPSTITNSSPLYSVFSYLLTNNYEISLEMIRDDCCLFACSSARFAVIYRWQLSLQTAVLFSRNLYCNFNWLHHTRLRNFLFLYCDPALCGNAIQRTVLQHFV